MADLGRLFRKSPLAADLGRLAWECPLVAGLGRLAWERPLVAELGISALEHPLAPHDLAFKFVGDLTSGAICCLPNKRDLLRSADRRLNLLSTRGETRGRHRTRHVLFGLPNQWRHLLSS